MVSNGFLRKTENPHWTEQADLSKAQRDGFDTRLSIETLVELTFRTRHGNKKSLPNFRKAFLSRPE